MLAKLDPQYIVGFIDGEGSFHVAIYKDKRMKTGLKIIPEFHVSQRVDSREVLVGLSRYFACGYIKANHATSKKDKNLVLVIRNRDDLLKKIIPFFEKYRLHTTKRRDFQIFAKIVRQMARGIHLNKRGASIIIKLAYQMNRGGKYRRHKHSLH